MMNPARKRKLLLIVFSIMVLMIATLLIAYALRQNISLFFTPTQIARGEAPENRLIRVGGMVAPGSIQRDKSSLTVRFEVTDYKNSIHVLHRGVVPDLFREGKGVVAQGQFNRQKNQLIASQILAKHDENYMPPEAKFALSRTTVSKEPVHHVR